MTPDELTGATTSTGRCCSKNLVTLSSLAAIFGLLRRYDNAIATLQEAVGLFRALAAPRAQGGTRRSSVIRARRATRVEFRAGCRRPADGHGGPVPGDG